VKSAISAALDVLNNPPQDAEVIPTSLHESVEVVALRWRDFLSIELSLLGDDVVEPKVAVIAQAVEEGITNSFRHGKATHITILIERKTTSLVLSIIDNGVGPSGGIFGIGSQTFDLLTGGNWSLSANASSAPGSTLTLHVTLTS
jgi:two-component sensor histidine kinase